MSPDELVPAPAATFAIPCYQGAAHLEPLLRSLLAQTRQDFELLLVDDGSRDDSIDIARRIAGDRLRIVADGQRRGLAGNFVHAAAQVRTPYFCLAHQDDVYAPRYLATLLPALEHAPDAGFAHCSATTIDGDGNAITAAAERFKLGLARAAVDAAPARLHELLWRGNFVCCPSVLFRTAAYHAVGGFDARLSFALDWDLWFRMVLAGQHIVTVLEPLLHYRRHGDNATRSATRTLQRFAEELLVLQTATTAAATAGLAPLPRRPDRSLRNNLVNEAFEDLRAGDRTAYRQKLRFLLDRLPRLHRDPYVLTLRLFAHFGGPGVSALGLLRDLAVRCGLG